MHEEKNKGYRNIDVVENRWKNHVYLQPFENDTLDRNNAAILLENTLKPISSSDPRVLAFERIRGDLTSQIFSRVASRKLFSVQAQLDHVETPTYLYLDEAARIIEGESTYTTNQHNVKWDHRQIEKIQSPHRYNAEVDMTRVYADEIAFCIDHVLLNVVKKSAATNSVWNFNTALGDTIKEKYESLYVKVIEVSNAVFRKVGRGGVNWLVTSPEIASIFETATYGFYPSPSLDARNRLLSVNYVGTINNRWRLYKDPLIACDTILLGYDGDTMVDSGLYFMPETLATISTKNKSDNCYPFVSKYAMEFKPGGEDYYATLKVEEFIL